MFQKKIEMKGDGYKRMEFTLGVWLTFVNCLAFGAVAFLEGSLTSDDAVLTDTTCVTHNNTSVKAIVTLTSLR